MRAWFQALELVEGLRGIHLLCLLPFTAICKDAAQTVSRRMDYEDERNACVLTKSLYHFC